MWRSYPCAARWYCFSAIVLSGPESTACLSAGTAQLLVGVVLVHDRVTLAAGDHVAVREKREGIGDRESCGDAREEEGITKPGVHRVRDQDHGQVVEHFHVRDRDRVGGQRR